MAFSTAVRSMRDGQLVIKDGAGTPVSVTVACDEGDLQWTETETTSELRCRGTATGFIKGEDSFCTVQFSVKVSQLISQSENPSDAVAVYEILRNNIDGDLYTSTSAGGVYTVDLEFTIVDPAGGTGTGEKVTFNDFLAETVTFQEGTPNMLNVSGKIPATRPVIERTA